MSHKSLQPIRLLVFLMVLFTVVSAGADQLLLNPSFESPATGSGQPDNWVRMNGERIVSQDLFPGVDPPVSSYPDGNQVVRAYVTSWGLISGPVGWYQTAKVIPGATYELSGFIWTRSSTLALARFAVGRIGADLDGASGDVAQVDIWCASPGQVDDMWGWTRSEGAWTRISASFTATSDYVTVYLDSRTVSTLEWMGVHFDMVTLSGPAPEPSSVTPTPYPSLPPTPTPTPLEDSKVGQNWTRAASELPWANPTSTGSVVFNDRIWAISTYPFPSRSRIWSSQDGVNWNVEVDSAPWGNRSSTDVLVEFNGRLWLFGGWDQTLGLQNDVWSSSDGVNWERTIENAPWSPRYGQEMLVHNGKLFLIGGAIAWRKCFSDVWSSANGVDWELVRGKCLWFGRNDFAAVSHNGRIYIMGGIEASDVWSSEDGSAWRLETLQAPWSGRYQHQAVVADGRMLVIGGTTPRFYGLNDVWSSKDGANWTLVTGAAEFEPRGEHLAVVFQNSLWVIGGLDMYGSPTTKSDVWRSGILELLNSSLMVH